MSTSSDDSDIPNVILDIDDKIPIIMEYNDENLVTNGINDLKCHLEKSISKLCDIIDKQNEIINLLKDEMKGKNLLIRALTMRDANIGSFIYNLPNQDSAEYLSNSINGVHSAPETPNPENVIEEVVINIESNCSESKSSLLHDQIISLDEKKYETAEYQLKNYRTAQALIYGIGPIDNPKASNPEHDSKYKFTDKFSWEKHSSGFGSKMLNKMGYKEGKGLGKAENGIKEPIKIIEQLNHKHNNNGKSKLMYILSDSMLSNIDPNRLSNKYLEVKQIQSWWM